MLPGLRDVARRYEAAGSGGSGSKQSTGHTDLTTVPVIDRVVLVRDHRCIMPSGAHDATPRASGLLPLFLPVRLLSEG